VSTKVPIPIELFPAKVTVSGDGDASPAPAEVVATVRTPKDRSYFDDDSRLPLKEEVERRFSDFCDTGGEDDDAGLDEGRGRCPGRRLLDP
jgi:hypothetical protein